MSAFQVLQIVRDGYESLKLKLLHECVDVVERYSDRPEKNFFASVVCDLSIGI